MKNTIICEVDNLHQLRDQLYDTMQFLEQLYNDDISEVEEHLDILEYAICEIESIVGSLENLTIED